MTQRDVRSLRPSFERMVEFAAATCRACAHHQAVHGVPCRSHTLPWQSVERARRIGLVR